MATCTRCHSGMRVGARFCTRCGAPAVAEVPAETEIQVPAVAEAPAPDPSRLVIGPPPVGDRPRAEDAIPSASGAEESTGAVLTIAPAVPPMPKGRRWAAPAARSHAATAAFATGLAPLLVSLVGNVVAADLTEQAAAQSAAGVTSGAWTPVFVALALVFVINAALLTVCAIAAGRGLRETANGITRGRGLAVAGLVIGAMNLVLWLIGLIVTLTTLTAALG
ncbi:zinc ribbon domain-containing protein [Microcella daejeonensis]|uniref:zinc ribbon domain-containing protein n=1 Tax=Microcella daejeonensis TaxID=2994971 RepID=UPI00226F8CA0|nr:zinc ribbon domain-containing protein [Microcella daejeonensis]WAB83718.1 zinc ribbon domain-containing protein [Microcella daejeonensis]